MPLPRRSLVRSVISVIRSVEQKKPGLGADPKVMGAGLGRALERGVFAASPVNSFLQRSRTLLSRFSSWICTFL